MKSKEFVGGLLVLGASAAITAAAVVIDRNIPHTTSQQKEACVTQGESGCEQAINSEIRMSSLTSVTEGVGIAGMIAGGVVSFVFRKPERELELHAPFPKKLKTDRLY